MRVNPLRCARGAITQTGVAAQFSAGALFNNDSTKFLAVLDWFNSDTNIMTTSVTQTRLTTQGGGLIDPVVTGESAPSGLLDSQALVAIPTPDFQTQIHSVSGFQGTAWHHDNNPFAVLRPGWSFVVTDNAVNASCLFAFFWMWLWPDELIDPKIGDPQVDY